MRHEGEAGRSTRLARRIADKSQALFALLARREPVHVIAASTGVSEKAVTAISTIIRFALAADDGEIDALIEFANRPIKSNEADLFFGSNSAQDVLGNFVRSARNEPAPAGGFPPPQPDLPVSNAILAHIEQQFSPLQMRNLAGSLLKLADAIEQDWNPDRVSSAYSSFSTAGRIEQRALALAKIAIETRERAHRRQRFLPDEFLGEPAWEILLELFTQFAGGAKVSTKSLCLVSGVPDTTAMRLIDRMEDASLVQRTSSDVDKRVTLVELTRQGVIAVGSALQEIEI